MGVAFSTALGFALTSLLIELKPGPNMSYLALVGVQAGRRAGYPRVLGYVFNPLTVYYGVDSSDRLCLMIYEVNRPVRNEAFQA